MMDRDAIQRLLPHRPPFLLIDEVVALEPGVRAEARYAVIGDEPWFAGHFPGSPILPGVLVTEALAQTAAVVHLSERPEEAGREVYLVGVDRMRFRRPVRPGDVLTLHVEVAEQRRRLWTFTARATVDGARVADGKLLATVPEQDGAAE